MRRLTTALILLAALTLDPLAAHAEPPRRAQITHEGTEGVWFRMDVARELLAVVEVLPLLQQHSMLLEERLRLREQEIALVRQALTVSIEETSRIESVLATADRRRREAEEALDAWYRSPYLWGGTGLLTGLGVMLLFIGLA